MAPTPAAAGHQQSSPPAAGAGAAAASASGGADAAANATTSTNRSSSASANASITTGGGGDRERSSSSSGSSSGKRRRSNEGEGGGGGGKAGSTSTNRGADRNKEILQRLHHSCDTHRSEIHDLDGNTDERLRSYRHYREPMAFASTETVEKIERLMDDRVEGSKSRGRCRKHLTSFRNVMARMEETYTSQSAKIAAIIERLDANTAAERSTDGDGGASAGAVDGRIGAGVEDKDMLETAGLASNLCIIYRLIIEGSFCPYSLYMIDWGRGGVHGTFCDIVIQFICVEWTLTNDVYLPRYHNTRSYLIRYPMYLLCTCLVSHCTHFVCR